MKTWHLALALLVMLAGAACNDDTVSIKGVVGTYDVMISQGGKSDPDILTIVQGSGGAVLLTFIAGITTDPGSVNENGLRATVGDGNSLTLAKQPAHIDHSTGTLNGTIWGTGTVNKMALMMTLHYLPTNFAVPTGNTDGGIVLTRDAGTGMPATLDYTVMGTRQ